MTIEELRSGKPFTVFGIPHDLKIIPAPPDLPYKFRLAKITSGEPEVLSIVTMYENYFDVVIMVFGIIQMIEISYSHCEVKE